jgi:hypothetical protein
VLLVFFKAHEVATKTVALSRMPSSLADDVSDAISDIAADEDDVFPRMKPRRFRRRRCGGRRGAARRPPRPDI